MMGIKVEFNPDLALRNIQEYKSGSRKKEECISESLEAGKTYDFLKQGQRNYWFDGEIPLLETKGNETISLPKASILILEATHFVQDGKIWTRGKYKVVEVFLSNDTIAHFNGFSRV